ncbi:Uncharacterized protein APZ42_004008, partial [Daphnia magna]
FLHCSYSPHRTPHFTYPDSTKMADVNHMSSTQPSRQRYRCLLHTSTNHHCILFSTATVI